MTTNALVSACSALARESSRLDSEGTSAHEEAVASSNASRSPSEHANLMLIRCLRAVTGAGKPANGRSPWLILAVASGLVPVHVLAVALLLTA